MTDSENSLSFLTKKGKKITLDLRAEEEEIADRAFGMAVNGAAEGTAVAAAPRLPFPSPTFKALEKKKNGRVLRLSLVLRPTVHAKNAILITAMAAVTLCEVLEAKTKKRYLVTWVNEVCEENGKTVAVIDAVSSMKADGYLHYLVLHLTWYLPERDFPEDLSDVVTEVFEGKIHGTVGRLAEDFLRAFFGKYETLAFDRAFIADYQKRSYLNGRTVYLLRDGKRRRVTVRGIDADARLLVETKRHEVIPVTSRSEIIL